MAEVHEQLVKQGAAAVEAAIDGSWRNGHSWGMHFEQERIKLILESYGRLCKLQIMTIELDRCMMWLRDGSCLCSQLRKEIEGEHE